MTAYLRNILKGNLAFLIPFAVIWIVAFAFSLMQGKAETHMIFNACHTPWADTFFKYFTQVGSIIPWLLTGVLLLYRYRITLFMLASQTATAILVYALKHLFSVPRPSVLLPELGYAFHTVDGVGLHSSLSFPSGHTASGFAMMFVLSVLCRHGWQKALCLVIAVLVGYSRIYLSQHFLQDVLAGSVVGIMAVLLTAYPFTERVWSKANLITTVRYKRHRDSSAR